MVDLVRHSARRGTAAVEAALMLPIVVFLTFALLTYGWVFIRSGQINNAARQGVRVAVRADSDNDAVLGHIQTLLENVGIPWNPADVTLTPAEVSGAPTGSIVTVTIKVKYAGTAVELIQMGGYIPVPGYLQSTVSMSKEGV